VDSVSHVGDDPLEDDNIGAKKLIEKAIVEDSRLLKGDVIAFNNAGQQPSDTQHFRRWCDFVAGSRIRNKTSLPIYFKKIVYKFK
jgi:hypothetical protein